MSSAQRMMMHFEMASAKPFNLLALLLVLVGLWLRTHSQAALSTLK
jgi:hypothetical protein